MEKHPLPQHISSYEFRLIGEMTIKQFAYLAAGAGIAFFIYLTKIPSLIKWFLIIFFSSSGAALAFVPVNDQPLSKWIFIFLRSVFSPTHFIWKKKNQTPDFLSSTSSAPIITPKPEQSLAKDTEKFNEYLSSLEPLEEEKIAKITQLFQTPAPTPVKSAPQVIIDKAPIFTPPPPPPPLSTYQPKQYGPQFKPHFSRIPNLGRPKPPEPAQLEAPTIPNVLIGITQDQNGSVLEGVIIEIRNSQQIPVRALKSNKLGHFRTATPLENDIYQIEAEKQSYNFETKKIEVKGEIVPPIIIRAK